MASVGVWGPGDFHRHRVHRGRGVPPQLAHRTGGAQGPVALAGRISAPPLHGLRLSESAHPVANGSGGITQPRKQEVARPFGSLRPAAVTGRRMTRIWTPPRLASTLFFGGGVRLLTYIRSLFRAFWHGTLMGYSRASSLLLCRACCTWSSSGFAGAGSTCSPSVRMLCNRG
jgi:hypothetical protein